uniref:Putative CRM domain-containing protein n=1 Tax=Rhizophora mucronata TaxID=61149 RepID=A0A2P2K288_RHIMU
MNISNIISNYWIENCRPWKNISTGSPSSIQVSSLKNWKKSLKSIGSTLLVTRKGKKMHHAALLLIREGNIRELDNFSNQACLIISEKQDHWPEEKKNENMPFKGKL